MPRASKATSRTAGPARKGGAAKKSAARSVAKKKKSATKAAKATSKSRSVAKVAKKTKKASSARKQAARATKKRAGAAPSTGRKKTTTAKATGAKSTATRTAPTKTAARRRGGAALDKFLEGQRKALLEERDTYLRQAETLKAEADALAEDMEPGDVQFDEESGEGDTINVERERDLALSAQARAAVEEIDKALVKIDEGSYGICEQCGEPIPKERLKALPYAALCVRCKSGGLGRR
jgi:RNA polymerase-binding protein DksA